MNIGQIFLSVMVWISVLQFDALAMSPVTPQKKIMSSPSSNSAFHSVAIRSAAPSIVSLDDVAINLSDLMRDAAAFVQPSRQKQAVTVPYDTNSITVSDQADILAGYRECMQKDFEKRMAAQAALKHSKIA